MTWPKNNKVIDQIDIDIGVSVIWSNDHCSLLHKGTCSVQNHLNRPFKDYLHQGFGVHRSAALREKKKIIEIKIKNKISQTAGKTMNNDNKIWEIEMVPQKADFGP